jgi:CheY-like chemotaxis protein
MTRNTPEFVVRCPQCAAPINADNAEWCRCATKQFTLSCPSCSSCFCKAPAESREVWKRAPKWLLEKRGAEQKRRSAALQPPSESVDILVVDDDEEIRLFTAYAVQEMGYRVRMISSPMDALQAIEESQPRIVITDALMPKMDGRQLCKLIKTAQPQVKVLVMTSLYTSSKYKNEAFKDFKADAYLAKPIDFHELQDALTKLDSAEASN